MTSRDHDSDFNDSDPDLDETPTVRCANCNAEVYEEADSCPACGEFLIDGGGGSWRSKPAWYVALGLLGVVAVLLTLSGVLNWL